MPLLPFTLPLRLPPLMLLLIFFHFSLFFRRYGLAFDCCHAAAADADAIDADYFRRRPLLFALLLIDAFRYASPYDARHYAMMLPPPPFFSVFAFSFLFMMIIFAMLLMLHFFIDF